MANRAIFLDRDGTLMEEVEYCGDPAKVKVFPGVREALQRLKEAGFLLIVVTNQSGIGRGFFTETEYQAVQTELVHQLGTNLIDGAYFCPDAPDAVSVRRKPEPGMLLEAARDFGIDLSRSFLIGDKCSDVECGKRAGTRTIQVMTGYGREQTCAPDFLANDLAEAAALVLEL
jgi:histidinol-phosphate phosphatase family protein